MIVVGIGPYEYKSMSHEGTYLIPGRQALSSNMLPVPPDGSESAKCDADLMWLAGYQAEAHDIHLGTDRKEVEERRFSVSGSNEHGFKHLHTQESLHLLHLISGQLMP